MGEWARPGDSRRLCSISPDSHSSPLAAGLTLDSFAVSLSTRVQTGLVAVLLLLGLACALGAWWRWARVEQALGRSEPLPAPHLAAMVAPLLRAVSMVLLVVAP